MFHSVSLLSQAPLARGSRALPSVLFSIGSFIVLKWKDESGVQQSMRILESVCNSWKDIAELIGLDSSRIKAIETVRKLDPKECCRDVFDDLRSSQPLQT